MVFLSVRVPAALRDRLKAQAARCGETVQGLLRELIESHLGRAEGADLAPVLARLRRRRDELLARGVRRLSVFGSVARGEAGPDSDVDLAVEFEAGREPSLLGFASLMADLQGLLGRKVDLAPWGAKKPDVRERALREAVEAL